MRILDPISSRKRKKKQRTKSSQIRHWHYLAARMQRNSRSSYRCTRLERGGWYSQKNCLFIITRVHTAIEVEKIRAQIQFLSLYGHNECETNDRTIHAHAHTNNNNNRVRGTIVGTWTHSARCTYPGQMNPPVARIYYVGTKNIPGESHSFRHHWFSFEASQKLENIQ